jgi:alpha-beta hydrolase superfamily lysophospholipase
MVTFMLAVRRTYAELNHWRKYQPLLPEALRITRGREPVEEWRRWRSADIHLDRYAVPGAPLTVFLLHGGGGCGRLLAPFGRMLHNRGYEVVAPDLPGYGLSIAPPEMFTYDSWVDCVVDLAAAEADRTGRPVALFGMSLGGYLGYLAAAKCRNVAGVIATTLADPRLPIVRDQFARHPLVNRVLAPGLPHAARLFGNVRLPVRWFSNMRGIANDPTLSELLSVDPVGGGNCVPLRFMHSLMSIKPALEPEQFDVCPLLLTHPAADRWTTPEASLPFFDRLRAPKQVIMLDNCGHFPIEQPGVAQLDLAVARFLKIIARRRPPADELSDTVSYPVKLGVLPKA